ncbi:LacI family DNA-binding transcriptional regulator [Pseudomaricurvus sp. HS19]|uniref:LacI family DNA-binding transcriptional regulator n=1 Tax=Pseudomaricurvus sp. HS19 TaxID=2692626 RepID=UPI00136A1957|nr:LacI family DNA-binding transcriptional regulator [Pseudomaricurvus sp. HS19]MYM62794.1 substrate-binding domain-containing protein [Pseudomaricurvus sp. HS19]
MVTIKDVARLAGVSIATVSRTLSKPDSVAEATREKVMTAVAKSGYVTNALASNFRRRQTNNVVVLVPDISNPFYAAVIQGIESRAMEAGYRILLGDTLHSREREKAYAQLVRQRQADGLICLGREIPVDRELNRKSADDSLPVVMACEYSGPLKVPSVVINNVQAAQDMVQHLLSLGHKRIGFINGPEDSPLCVGRLQGYCDALRVAGIEVKPALIEAGDFSLASGYEAARRLFKQRSKPTALFCACDEMAIGAMHAARDLGMDIPGDLAIAGFDDIDAAAYSYPPLTTVRQPRSEIGQTAMALMLEALGEKPPMPRLVILPHELVVRASTATQ